MNVDTYKVDETASKTLPALDETPNKRPYIQNVLIGCTGSVASLKIPLLVTELSKFVNVKVVATENATHFFNTDVILCEIYTDKDEWSLWTKRSDPVLHIELRRWADVFVIAPLDANTLAKMAHGICDNLLTCVVRAWDMQQPLLFAPAMNTHMWEHPITSKQIAELKSLGYKYVPVIEKTLVCGDKGLGAMAEVDTIVQYVKDALHECDSSNQNSKIQRVS